MEFEPSARPDLNPGFTARMATVHTVFPYTDPDDAEQHQHYISAVAVVVQRKPYGELYVVFHFSGMMCASPLHDPPDPINFNYYMADVLDGATVVGLATFNPETERYEQENPA